MTRKTYTELVTAFADNSTGNITPEDLRNFLEAVAVERAQLWDNESFVHTVQTANTYEPVIMEAEPEDIKNSDNISIAPNGIVTVDQLGLVDFICFLQVDTSSLANGQTTSMQLWGSADGINWGFASGEDVHTKRPGINIVSHRVTAESFIEGVPRYMQVRLECSSVESLPVLVSYITAKINPIIRE